MIKLLNSVYRHKIFAAFLVLLILAGLSYASISFAKPEPAKEQTSNCLWYRRTTYYSDASLTTVVGTQVFFCDGNVGTSGTVTQFSTFVTCECIEE
jgi:hypothetical protein